MVPNTFQQNLKTSRELKFREQAFAGVKTEVGVQGKQELHFLAFQQAGAAGRLFSRKCCLRRSLRLLFKCQRCHPVGNNLCARLAPPMEQQWGCMKQKSRPVPCLSRFQKHAHFKKHAQLQ